MTSCIGNLKSPRNKIIFSLALFENSLCRKSLENFKRDGRDSLPRENCFAIICELYIRSEGGFFQGNNPQRGSPGALGTYMKGTAESSTEAFRKRILIDKIL